MMRVSRSHSRHAVSIIGALLIGWHSVECQAASPAAFLSGPFELRENHRSISSGAFPNSPNLFSRKTVSEWELFYKGKPVQVFTKDGRSSQFYEIWLLEGARKPAALLASNDFYLAMEEGERLTTRLLSENNEGDFARYQWLDHPDGQPSSEEGVFIRDRRGESRILKGGTLLLLNTNAVLDVTTLQLYPLHAPLHDVELGDYAVANQQARALSPDKAQLVLAGERPTDNDSETALVVIEIRKDRGYVVPYDRTLTRVESAWDVTPAWLHHYFQWEKQTDGSVRLALKPHPERLPWIGRLSDGGDGMMTYYLDSVSAGMMLTVREFLKREFHAQTTAVSTAPDTQILTMEKTPFVLAYDRPRAQLTLKSDARTVDRSIVSALIQRVGSRFNTELGKGLHQKEFIRKSR